MMKKLIYVFTFLACTLSGFANTHPTLIGHYGKWSSFEMKEDGKKVCYMLSNPIKQEGSFKKRGSVYVMITHRPASKSFNVVSFHAGYTFEKSSPLIVNIGKEKFELFTQGESAWANDEMDGAIVKAIKKGENIIAAGKSSKGTASKDTYSLNGSNQAYHAINKACGL